MSFFNWIIDLDQESKLLTQQEQIDQLQARVEVLEQWIQYFQHNNLRLDHERTTSS